jgi:Uncharacterized protein conserved in bacteria
MKIQETVMKLLLEQPYYGYIASSVTMVETSQIPTIQIASIPDLIINYNVEWFDSLSNTQQMGTVLHELLHVILMHQFRRGNREIILWSVACDMAVHEMFPVKYIDVSAVTVEKMEKKLKRSIQKNQNAEFYYSILMDVDDFISFVTTESDSILISEGGQQLQIQKISEKMASTTEISALKTNLAQTFSEAKTEGEVPDGLEDRIDEIYKDIRINWRVILKRFLTGRGKMVTRKSYKRQSRRYEDLPGTKRSIGINALIAIDESGSISDAQVKKFYEELVEINKITCSTMLVTRFDTQCSDPVPLNTFVVHQKRAKRGGTDFRPIFQLADERKIPLVIIFTDGDGEAPLNANQKTLWILTKQSKKPAKFGYYLNYEE